MVATVQNQPSFPVQQQQNTAAHAAEVRARNEQTQPKQAPAADSQKSEQKTLQSKDDLNKRETKKLQQPQEKSHASSSPVATFAADQRRGTYLDVTA